MGRLIVEEIRVRDFRSYRGNHRIRLGGRGPAALVGKNGAGKSSIVSLALTWCLYGKCPPEAMGSGTQTLEGKDIVHELADGCEAEVTLLFDPPQPGLAGVRITRTRKKTAETLVLTAIDDAGAEPDYGHGQAAVDTLVGAPYDVFVRTVVRAQNDPWNFAEATDGKKREIVDSVSGAALLNVPHERAKALRTARATLCESLRSRVADARRRADAEDATELRRNAAQWALGRAPAIEAALEDVRGAEALLEAARRADAEALLIDARLGEIAARRPVLDFTPYDAAIRPAEAEWTRIDRLRAAAQAALAAVIALGPGAECPTCGTTVTAETPVAKRRDVCAHTAADLDQAEWHAREELRVARETRAAAAAWLNEAIAVHEVELRAVGSPSRGPTTGPAEHAVRMATARLRDVRAAEDPFAEAVRQVEARRIEFERAHAAAAEALLIAEGELVLAQAWEDVLSPKGVRAHLADSALAAIELGANRWLDLLSGGRMSVEFPSTRSTGKGVVREEIQTIIQAKRPDGTRHPRRFLTYSGGERTRVNIAVDLGVAAAFGRGGGLAISLLVLDEQAFSGMDEDGKLAIATALHHAGVADVIIVDHDPRLASSMPRTIQASRGPDGYSRIEEVA